jgi:DNA-binding HxlR family transcriptional regulator
MLFVAQNEMTRYEIRSRDMTKARIPKPGRRARGSTTGRPVMVLLDLLGRRRALRVIWELREDKRLNFRELEQATGASPSVLNTRLGELRESGIVLHDDGTGYGLTPSGADLLVRLMPLHDWADIWAEAKR